MLYTDGLIESERDMDDGEHKLLKAARDAIDAGAPNPARFIAEGVLKEEPQYPDDVAVLTIFFR